MRTRTATEKPSPRMIDAIEALVEAARQYPDDCFYSHIDFCREREIEFLQRFGGASREELAARVGAENLGQYVSFVLNYMVSLAPTPAEISALNNEQAHVVYDALQIGATGTAWLRGWLNNPATPVPDFEKTTYLQWKLVLAPVVSDATNEFGALHGKPVISTEFYVDFYTERGDGNGMRVFQRDIFSGGFHTYSRSGDCDVEELFAIRDACIEDMTTRHPSRNIIYS